MQNPRNTLQDNFQLLILSVFSLFFLLFNLQTGSLASWDEAIYGEVAKQVVRSGNWLDLTWGGGPWVDKPPVTIWATAFLYKLLGVGEGAARLFSALCGVGTVLTVYLFGRRLFGRWEGFLAGLALLSTMHFIRMARFGMTDMPLVFFVTLSLYFFWRGREEPRHLVWSGVFFGVAFMTKSFAALFAPAVIWTYCFLAGETKILRSRAYSAGMAAALAIALPWNLYLALNRSELFFSESLTKHFVLRTTQALEGHGGTWYFYIRTILNKFRPWILVGAVAAPYFLFESVRSRRKEFIFVTVWMFLVFLVITGMKTKLHWYLLPVYPALSLAIGWCMARFLPEKRRYWAVAGFLGVMAVHIFYSNVWGLDYSRPLKAMAPLVHSRVPEDATVFLYNYHEQPAAIYYWERKIKYLDATAALRAAIERDKPFYCLFSEKDLHTAEKALPLDSFSALGTFEDRILVTTGKA